MNLVIDPQTATHITWLMLVGGACGILSGWIFRTRAGPFRWVQHIGSALAALITLALFISLPFATTGQGGIHGIVMLFGALSVFVVPFGFLGMPTALIAFYALIPCFGCRFAVRLLRARSSAAASG